MLKKIKYLIIDVDGTMTDAGIYYDENGNELKKFSTRDAAGFYAARRAGIKTVVLTGRESAATTRRMKELKVDFLFKNVKDKYGFLYRFMRENEIQREEMGYIGDDLNDLQPMTLAGFIGCPADSCSEVLAVANYVSPVKGGCGTVRDVVQYLLKNWGEWETAVSDIYGMGN